MTAPRLFLRKLVAFALVTPLAGCSVLFGDQYLPSYRYRITVEVDTPEGLKSGSSVLQVDSLRGPGWAPEKYAVGRSLHGDAVTINLGRRGKLFMILRDGNRFWGDEVMLDFVRDSFRGIAAEDVARVNISHILALRGRRRLERRPLQAGFEKYNRYWGDNYPELLTFADPRRPASARWVTPEHLERNFGVGVSLRQITVEITNDPVTQTITNVLPWVIDERSFEVIPAQLPNAPEAFNQRLDKIDFRRTIGDR